MLKEIDRTNLEKYFCGLFGGFLGGLAVSSNAWIICMPISLAIMWSNFDKKGSNFLWGFAFVIVSHCWILYLHPLTWLGFSWISSILATSVILIICSFLGGGLVMAWGLCASQILNKRNISYLSSSQLFIKVFFLSTLWGVGELILSQSPYYWIGLGEGLIPGDLLLAGMAKWIGARGLSVLQICFGFWLFFIYFKWKKKLNFQKTLFAGLILLFVFHFLGATLIQTQLRNSPYPIAIWQTNIPTKDKLTLHNQQVHEKFVLAQKEALKTEAKILVAPEGTTKNNFKFIFGSRIDTLTGGFRLGKNGMRSSLLAFKKGNESFDSYLDKNRLVPLGEKVPSYLNKFNLSLSSLGGLQKGNASRYFKWSNSEIPPLAVAICYEISNGEGIRKAVKYGSKLILSVANLDPYPQMLHDQFISNASLRSIENDRDSILISNTGPSGVIRNDGRIMKLLEKDQELISLFLPNLSKKKTFYTLNGDKPLVIIFFLLLWLNYFHPRN